jgi:hypothetical protein
MAEFEKGDRLVVYRKCDKDHMIGYCTRNDIFTKYSTKIVYLDEIDSMNNGDNAVNFFAVDVSISGNAIIGGNLFWAIWKGDIENFKKMLIKDRVLFELKQ